jgi:hypothetical protein
MRGRVQLWFVALCVALASAGAVAQQTTLPLDRLRPAPEGAGFVRTPGAAVPGHGGVVGAAVVDFGWQPLVIRDAEGAVLAAVVQSRLGTQLSVGIGLFDVASVSAQLPVIWMQTQGDLGQFAAPLGLEGGLAPAGLGDLSLQAKVRMVDEGALQLALLAQVGVPTAVGVGGAGGVEYGGGFLGDGPGAFSIAPSLALSYDRRFVQLRSQLGYRVRPVIQLGGAAGGVVVHPDLFGRVGLGTSLADYGSLPPVVFFAEVAGATPDRFPFGLFVPDVDGDDAERLKRQSALSTVVEWGVGARYRVGDAIVEGSVGAGLVAGFGAADVRVLLGLRWEPEDVDPDGDGIGADDVCPDAPEDKDGFQDSDGCPEYDNDGDGLPDAADACPDEAEDFDGDGDADGCADA